MYQFFKECTDTILDLVTIDIININVFSHINSTDKKLLSVEFIKVRFNLYFFNNSPFVNCYITVISNLYYVSLGGVRKGGYPDLNKDRLCHIQLFCHWTISTSKALKMNRTSIKIVTVSCSAFELWRLKRDWDLNSDLVHPYYRILTLKISRL